MSEEVKTTVPEKPVFVSTERFQYKGEYTSIPVMTQRIDKGKAAGDEYMSPEWDKTTIGTLAQLFKPEILLDFIAPELYSFCFQASRQAAEKAKNTDGTIDQDKLNLAFSNILKTLSLNVESLRSLNAKLATYSGLICALVDIFDDKSETPDAKVSYTLDDKVITCTQMEANVLFEQTRTNLKETKKAINLLKEKQAAKLQVETPPVATP